MTPQESEQLSKYVSNDSYVKQQKEDIEELASMFKDMLGKNTNDDKEPFVKEFQNHFVAQDDFKANYSITIEGYKNPLYISVNNDKLEVYYAQKDADVYGKMPISVMQAIVDGRMTFQRAFMTGDMSARGNFKTLRMLDQVFLF